MGLCVVEVLSTGPSISKCPAHGRDCSCWYLRLPRHPEQGLCALRTQPGAQLMDQNFKNGQSPTAPSVSWTVGRTAGAFTRRALPPPAFITQVRGPLLLTVPRAGMRAARPGAGVEGVPASHRTPESSLLELSSALYCPPGPEPGPCS